MSLVEHLYYDVLEKPRLKHAHSQHILFLGHRGVCLEQSWVFSRMHVSIDTRFLKIKGTLNQSSLYTCWYLLVASVRESCYACGQSPQNE